MFKEEIREKLIKQRNSLKCKDVLKNSMLLFNNFKNLFKQLNMSNKVIAGYYPIKNEINDLKILFYLKIKYNCQIVFPIIYGNNIIFVEKNKKTINFIRTPSKIHNNISHHSEIIPNILLVPGIAFDKFKNRIGFGYGFYDKYFNNNIDNIRIGICHDFQLLNKELPHEKHDIKMNFIITEKQLIY